MELKVVELNVMVGAKNKEIKLLEEKIQALESQAKAGKKKQQQLIEKLNKDNMALTAKAEQFEHTVERLKGENSALQNKLNAANASLASKESEVMRAAEQLRVSPMSPIPADPTLVSSLRQEIYELKDRLATLALAASHYNLTDGTVMNIGAIPMSTVKSPEAIHRPFSSLPGSRPGSISSPSALMSPVLRHTDRMKLDAVRPIDGERAMVQPAGSNAAPSASLGHTRSPTQVSSVVSIKSVLSRRRRRLQR